VAKISSQNSTLLDFLRNMYSETTPLLPPPMPTGPPPSAAPALPGPKPGQLPSHPSPIFMRPAEQDVRVPIEKAVVVEYKDLPFIERAKMKAEDNWVIWLILGSLVIAGIILIILSWYFDWFGQFEPLSPATFSPAARMKSYYRKLYHQPYYANGIYYW